MATPSPAVILENVDNFLKSWGSFLILDQMNRARLEINHSSAHWLFFLRGGGGYTHSGYHKTLSATIACDRTSCETETHSEHCTLLKDFPNQKKEYHF